MICTAASNNSMDVRAKQRLCYRVVLFPLTCVVVVSPHVISTVSRFSIGIRVAASLKSKAKTLRVSSPLCEVKRRAEDDDAANKSMNARRNSYPVIALPGDFTSSLAVSPALSQPLCRFACSRSIKNYGCLGNKYI